MIQEPCPALPIAFDNKSRAISDFNNNPLRRRQAVDCAGSDAEQKARSLPHQDQLRQASRQAKPGFPLSHSRKQHWSASSADLTRLVSQEVRSVESSIVSRHRTEGADAGPLVCTRRSMCLAWSGCLRRIRISIGAC